MKRTTVFLTEELERLLQETARRTRRPQAEIVRDALAQYLEAQRRPWPQSLGTGKNADGSGTSENGKEWVRERWLREMRDPDDTETGPHAC